MAKSVDLKAAKAAKQKKIAIGGAVLLLALLAVSVPRTMKMLSHKPPASATSTPSSTSTTPSATASTPAAAVPSAMPVSHVLSAPLEPAATEGQLARLHPGFTSKDPFVPQMKVDVSASATASTSSTAAQTAKQQAQSQPSLKVVPSTPSVPPNTASSTPPSSTPSVPTPTARPAVQPYMSATISVNRVSEGVNVKDDFPAASPMFHLVSVTKKTATISIAGGSLAGGDATLTLERGKAVTLMNTADGTRYRLVLLGTSTAAAAPPATPTTPNTGSAPAATATTTTPTTTTPTTPTIGG